MPEETGTEQCDLCESPADEIATPVRNEETGEVRNANLCEEHRDKLDRYNRGEEVDWNV